jgi:N,N'-diacetyllegionaminate synthase
MALGKDVIIEGRKIGDSHPTFIIAEIGMNHNGSMELAKKIIDAAVDAGVDAVKFQMFTADKLVTGDAETYGNEDGHLPQYQQEMYRKYEFTKVQYSELKDYCDSKGIIFFASVWDEENADLLDEVGGNIFKFGSADITHLPLIEHVAMKGKPMIISTGMSTMDEVRDAVDAITRHHDNLILLHCVSSYPAKTEDANLRSMLQLRDFGFPIGFSDHTMDILTSVAAVAIGAKVIEKHFTIDRKIPGVDHHLSLEPKEMRELVEAIRNVEKMLGSHGKKIMDAELETRKMARRSIIAKTDIPKGTKITKDMLVIKRPGYGIVPKELHSIIGKTASQDIKADTLIDYDMLG